MNRNLALALGLAAALGLVLFSVSRSPGPASPLIPAGPAGPASKAPASGDLVRPLAEPESPLTSPAAPTRQLGAGALPGARAAPEARWITGRVLLPPRVPGDEDLRLFAVGFGPDEERDRDAYLQHIRGGEGDYAAPAHPRGVAAQGRELPCELEADGRFRAPFSERAVDGVLRLDGRYLHAPRVRLDLTAEVPELVIEPALGAWLTVEFTPPASPPADFDPAAPGPFHVVLGATGKDGQSGVRSPPIELERSLQFEVRGLPAERQFSFLARPAQFQSVRWTEQGAPGQHLTRTVPLTLGARIAGRVIDSSGSGVSSAVVTAWWSVAELRGVTGEREATTDATGAFLLRGLQPGELELVATATDLVESAPAELTLARDEVLEDFEVTLEAGSSLTGLVTWPDGTPAVGVSIRIREGVGKDARTVLHFVEYDRTTGADGRFAFSGLGPEPVSIVATPNPLKLGITRSSAKQYFERLLAWRATEPELEPLADAEHLGWRAEARGVMPGSDLTLVLAPPVKLEGRVIDERGQPVREFSIRSWSLIGTELAAPAKLDFTDEDGRFVLERQPVGEWMITARVPDHARGSAMVTVPSDAPIELVCKRLGTVSGTVTDALGNPIAGASVQALKEGEVVGINLPLPGGVETDADGRFSLGALDEGEMEVHATHPDWAQAEPVRVQIVRGAALQDIRLTLRAGGRLTGIVFDEHGAPESGRAIIAGKPEVRNGRSIAHVYSDDRGEFRFEHLAPGRTRVDAHPPYEAQSSEADRRRRTHVAFVDIVVGQTAHVTLGAPPEAPVRVFGRVTEAGSPRGGGGVIAVPEGSSIEESVRYCEVSPAGEYELELDAPGRYLIIAQGPGRGAASVTLSVVIPEVVEYRLDLALPTGRIAGLVLQPDGAPASGINVNCFGTGPLLLVELNRNVRTDADGAFELRSLAPDTYTLRAEVRGKGMGGSRYAITVAPPIVLARGQFVDDIVLHLLEAATIEGVVLLPGGEPAAGAWLFFRDAAGRVLNPVSKIVTDADGHFGCDHVSAGAFTVSARLGQLAAPESAPVEAAPGTPAELTLQLEAATLLTVVLLDATGEPVPAGVQVLDPEGRRVGHLLGPDASDRLKAEGLSSTEHRVGPLVPGTYRVTLRTPDGRTATRSVTLTGEPEQRLELTLPE